MEHGSGSLLGAAMEPVGLFVRSLQEYGAALA